MNDNNQLVHPLEALLEAAVDAQAAVANYFVDNNYELLERKGVAYAVHPEYVERFNSHYNGAIKGGWFGIACDSPAWAAIRL